MDEDGQIVEDLFHAASALPADERASYLARAVDPALRAEVESLLAVFDMRADFLERPILSLGMKVLTDELPEDTLVDTTVGAYKILKPLGRGGMGKVYLAEDERLQRNVALKFLSPRFLDDAWAKRQFVKEAQAAAKLDHPNICPVYGFEEADGYSFMVMKYVEGETLASLCCAPAEPARALDLAAQIAGALAEAHAHGIIHRDIKPQNIIVTTAGQAKVLDFGLAKIVRQGVLGAGEGQSQASQKDVIVGTVAYMSPEQLRAERLDFRSDIFSFGVVLYEMVTGGNPFARASDAEIISAILTSEPPPLRSAAADFPAGFSHIVERCLAKNREGRYQSASELLLDLGSLPQRRAHLPLLAGVAFALVLLVSLAVILSYFRAHRVRTLSIIPVVNESGVADTDYLDAALTEGLSRRLSRLSKLHVKVLSGASAAEAQKLTPQEAGRVLGSDAILTGTIRPRGESLVLQLRLTDTSGGGQNWESEYDLSPAEIENVLAAVSGDTAARLVPGLSADERSLLSRSQGEENPVAFRLYFRGRHYWNNREKDKENITKAIQSFSQATEVEPEYARAWAGLADCYVVKASPAYGSMEPREALAYAKSAAMKALSLDSTLAEAHTSLGMIELKGEWNWQEAEKEFRQAIRSDPDYAPAHYWYSTLLALTGRAGEAVTESETAWDLEPLSPLSDINVGRTFYYARQYERAIGYFRRALEKEPEDKGAMYLLGLAYLQEGRDAEAIDLFEKVYAADKLVGAAPLGYAYARAGRKEEARHLLEEIGSTARQHYVSPQEKAVIYAGLGDKDQSFVQLQKSCDERFISFPFVMIDPLFDSLRSDPRHAALARCANLSP